MQKLLTKRAIILLTSAAAVLGATTPAVAATPTAGTQHVSYRGYDLQVPAAWQVVDLEKAPRTCVRADHNTVYLGTPGADQDCPAHGVGDTADGLLIEPAASAAQRGAQAPEVPAGTAVPQSVIAKDAVAHQFRVGISGTGLLVTANYRDSAATVNGLLAGAKATTTGTTGSTSKTPVAPRSVAPNATTTVPSTVATGYGFDACEAPSANTMQTWRASSPYRTVGVYIGGAARTCKEQANLTPGWVSARASEGWSFLPIYVGPQATISPTIPADAASAQQAGTAAASDAVNQAANLGFALGSVLYVDVENYGTTYHDRVQSYLTAWTKQIRALGFRSGVYSSASSGIKDLAAQYNQPGSTNPDVVWSANWNSQDNVSDGAMGLPGSGYWPNAQRVHQYQNVTDSYGGISINIDRDYLNVGGGSTLLKPAAQLTTGWGSYSEAVSGDFTGDGKADLVARDNNSGTLYLWPGNGQGGFNSSIVLTTGWGNFSQATAGDFTGDGKADLIARNNSNGVLYLWPGNGQTGFNDSIVLTTGWGNFSQATAGDFTGDGKADLIARNDSNGVLYLWPGNGQTGFNDSIVLTTGWGNFSEATTGDFTGDGKADLIARNNTDGNLYLWPGNGQTGFNNSVVLITGWSAFSQATTGDFNGDGKADLLGRNDPTGNLYMWAGTGGS
ncbi:glycoside hydrolase domain-containing protein [Kitasatospora sp. McL0602]|uniref:glycoside hydrolase domain-containing protein n=1 Tax=Kitasatospora sp. McL0602 TaxID=3439530 RepID=UPI003F8C1ECB